MALQEMLSALKKNHGCIASAVVSRDGTVIASDMPSHVSSETFSIMCATIMGAGMTAAVELKKGSPRKVVLESEDSKIVIFEAGRRSMVVVVIPSDKDVNEVETLSKNIVAEASKI